MKKVLLFVGASAAFAALYVSTNIYGKKKDEVEEKEEKDEDNLD